MKKLLLVTLIGTLASSYASASENPSNKYNGFYIGAGVGTTDFHYDKSLASSIENNHEVGYSNKADGESYKLIAGYQFNRIVALEAQYTTYGDIKNTLEVKGHKFTGKTEHQSFSLAANLGYTFDNGLRPFALVGLGQISVKEPGFKDDGGLIRLGAGLEYQIKQVPGLGIRTAYEADFYTLEATNKDYDMSVGSWYLGATYKF
ncbi:MULTISPECIES: outer membrane beta-barrel protein [unclassified Photobacterium]|uniref:outer membrane beta-barrel protein n=1 Tax=unclassified Photobacterium TaxID=2628852 RepID=UPI001EDE69E1|nr:MULTISPECIES: outer membrane beta-barrel protein [unclassified Photobacterium]MCG3864892.1 porin family protein [Photobacterium sp. Ph6]MCG3876300.1 porin family protein [Photobacterium sp. Ph5]